LQANAKRDALERVIVVNERILAHSETLDRRLHASREARLRLAEAVQDRRRDLEKMRDLLNRHELDADFLHGGSAVLEPFRPTPVLVPSELPASMAPSPDIVYDERHEQEGEDDDDEEDEAERAARIRRLEGQVAALKAQLCHTGETQMIKQDAGVFPIYCDTPFRPRSGPPRTQLITGALAEVQLATEAHGRVLQALDNLEC